MSHGVPQAERVHRIGTPSLMLTDRKGRLRLHEFGRVDDLALGFALGELLAEHSGQA